jgi:hypothetical protein
MIHVLFFRIIQFLADGQRNETINAPGGLNQKGSLPQRQPPKKSTASAPQKMSLGPQSWDQITPYLYKNDMPDLKWINEVKQKTRWKSFFYSLY